MNKSAKRYDIEQSYLGGAMIEREDGDYVLFDEIEKSLDDAYAAGRKDEAAKWDRVGFIGLDAALILANTKATITTTITKEPPFADYVELWALWMKA